MQHRHILLSFNVFLHWTWHKLSWLQEIRMECQIMTDYLIPKEKEITFLKNFPNKAVLRVPHASSSCLSSTGSHRGPGVYPRQHRAPDWAVSWRDASPSQDSINSYNVGNPYCFDSCTILLYNTALTGWMLIHWVNYWIPSELEGLVVQDWGSQLDLGDIYFFIPSYFQDIPPWYTVYDGITKKQLVEELKGHPLSMDTNV